MLVVFGILVIIASVILGMIVLIQNPNFSCVLGFLKSIASMG